MGRGRLKVILDFSLRSVVLLKRGGFSFALMPFSCRRVGVVSRQWSGISWTQDFFFILQRKSYNVLSFFNRLTRNVLSLVELLTRLAPRKTKNMKAHHVFFCVSSTSSLFFVALIGTTIPKGLLLYPNERETL